MSDKAQHNWVSFDLSNLKRGDIVRPRDGGLSYVVMANYGDRATAAASADITNAYEWQVLK